MSTTIIVALGIAIVIASLFMFKRNYDSDNPITYRTLNPDAPMPPMTEDTMPDGVEDEND